MPPNNPDLVIETHGLRRDFGSTVALRDFSLSVPRGSIYGFLGRNGAGKTTAIKILAGLIRPHSGSLRVLDGDPFTFTPAQRTRLGYVSEKQILPPTLTVDSLLDFCRPLYPRWDDALARRLIHLFALDTGKRIKALSQGGQRQVAFILALAQRPDLLILDEPASSLDVVARREFLDAILDLLREDGLTVFLSSHILSDIERVADHIGILVDGSLRISEPLDDLKESLLRVRFFHPGGRLDGFTIPGALRFEASGSEALAILRSDHDSITRLAASAGLQYEIQPLSLEDIFVEISRRSTP